MHCDVLLFAQLAEAVGARRVTIELNDPATVRDALDELMRMHPALASLRDRVAVAVDERYVSHDTSLRAGQTMALIPPVSGG